MAYRAKKKSVGSKILVWICLLAIVASSAIGIVYYIIAM